METNRNLGSFDTEENRQRYQEYLDNPNKQSHTGNGYTVEYNGQTFQYTNDQIDRLKHAYSLLNKDSDYAQKAYMSYKDTDFDRYAMQNGLPSWSLWSSVEKYAAKGGLKDNYGGLNDAQWDKIKELWAKDWEYGLTDADAVRKALGYAPVSYDSMYEDTLLDDELKAANLPPSKLLNGKLGEKYNEWVTNENTSFNIYDEVAKELARAQKNGEELTVTDAFTRVAAMPEYTEFANEHFGIYGEEPELTSDKYKITQKVGTLSIPVNDENGNPMYDEEAYTKDLLKVRMQNAKLDNDEFAITLDKLQKNYEENAVYYNSYIRAEEFFENRDVTEEQFYEKMNDYAAALSVNGGNGFTVQDIFTGIEEKDAYKYQPIVDKINSRMFASGFSAAQDYMNSVGFKYDLRKIAEEDFAEAYRQQFPEAENMTTEQIIDKYYSGIENQYGFSKAQLEDFRDGKLDIDQYMSETVQTDDDAWAFAKARLQRELAAQGLPTTLEELEDEQTIDHWIIMAKSIATQEGNAIYGGLSLGLLSFDSFSPAALQALLDPDAAANMSRQEKIDFARETYDAMVNSYYTEAVSYSKDYQARFENAETERYNGDTKTNRVYAEFRDYAKDALTDKYANGDSVINNRQLQNILSNATEDEQRMAVYLSEKNWLGEEYIKGLATKYSNEEKSAFTEYVSEMYRNASPMGKFVLRNAANTFAVVAQPIEGIYNFASQTFNKVILGRDLYSNQMLTWSSDMFSAVAGEVTKENGKFLGTVYQAVPSFMQSTGSAALAIATHGGSEVFTLAAMATQAYSSATENALMNGVSSEKAYAIGVAAGVAEFAFEKISLDAFLEGVDGFNAAFESAMMNGGKVTLSEGLKLGGKMLTHQAMQGFVEGTEEGSTDIANIFAEGVLLGYDADYEKNKRRYMEIGLSEQEASRLAGSEIIQSVKNDMIVGAVTGALQAFGSDIITVGGKIQIDQSGISRFTNTMQNLSGISYEDALNLANSVAVRDANGMLTLEGAKRVVAELTSKGADASMLMKVNLELTKGNANANVNTYMNEQIGKQLQKDKLTVLAAAQNVLAKKGTNREYVNALVNQYMNDMSDAISRSDAAKLDKVYAMMKRGLYTKTLQLAGEQIKYGAQTVAAYLESAPEDVQTTIRQNAERYVKKFNEPTANLNGNDALEYAMYAATLAHIVDTNAQSADFAKGSNFVFGTSAGTISTAVENACLNSSGVEAKAFVDTCLEAIAAHDASDTSLLMNQMALGMSGAQYSVSSLALASQQKAGSMQRSLYEYMVKNGVSESALNLLGAMQRYESMNDGAMKAAENDYLNKGDAVMTSDQTQELADEYLKLWRDYNEKKNALELRKQRNDVSMVNADSNVVRYQAEYDAFHSETVVDANGNAVRSIPNDMAEIAERTNDALQRAIEARDKLSAENEGKLADSQKEFNTAEEKLKSAETKFDKKMNGQAYAFIQQMRHIITAIQSGNKVELSNLDRETARFTYGTAEDLNDIEMKMIAAEKDKAVALGRAIGIDVECVDFNDRSFQTKFKVSANERGFEEGGKVYLNESAFKDKNGIKTLTGAGVDYVLLHEFGHAVERFAAYNKYFDFAWKYMVDQHGADAIDSWVKNVMEKRGYDELKAQKEVVAEFTRENLLNDPKAIRALCKAAPVMSTRIMQWLTNAQYRVFGNVMTSNPIVSDALRYYAKALKAYRAAPKAVANQTEVARAKDAYETADKVKEAANKKQSKKAAAAPVQQAAAPVQTEKTDTRAQTETQTNAKSEPENINQAAEKFRNLSAEERREFIKKRGGDLSELDDASSVVAEYDANEQAEDNFIPEAPPEDTSIAYGEEAEQQVAEPVNQPVEDFAEQEEQTEEDNTVRLPFQLTPETRERIVRIVMEQIRNNADSDGRLPKAVNEMIVRMVTWQVNHDANYTQTDADTVRAFAEQFTRPQIEAEPEAAPVQEQEQAEAQPEQTVEAEQKTAEPSEVTFSFEIGEDVLGAINQYVENARRFPQYFNDNDIKNFVVKKLVETAKAQHKRKPSQAKMEAYAQQFLIGASGNTRQTDTTRLYANDMSATGADELRSEDLSRYARNQSFFDEFVAETLAQNNSVTELNDKYMPLAKKIVDGTATEAEIAEAQSYVQAVAMKKGVMRNAAGNMPLDLFHGTPEKFGFTKFRRGDRPVQKHLTFTSTTAAAANSYTSSRDKGTNVLSRPHTREIRSKGNTYADAIRKAFRLEKDDVTLSYADYKEYANNIGASAADLIAADAKSVFGLDDKDTGRIRGDVSRAESKLNLDKKVSGLWDVVLSEDVDNIKTDWESIYDDLPDIGLYMDELDDNNNIVSKRLSPEEARRMLDLFEWFVLQPSNEWDNLVMFGDGDTTMTDKAGNFSMRGAKKLLNSHTFNPDIDFSKQYTIEELGDYMTTLDDIREIYYTLRQVFTNDNTLQSLEEYGDDSLISMFIEHGAEALDKMYSAEEALNGSNEVVFTTPYGEPLTISDVIANIASFSDTGVYHLYGNAGENPYEVDADKSAWHTIRGTILEDAYNEDTERFVADPRYKRDKRLKGLSEERPLDTNSTAEFARRSGYSSTRINNVYDSGSHTIDARNPTDLVIFYDQMGFKSADVVTLDDNNEIIPLTERFNWAEKDIRYFTEIDAIETAINKMSAAEAARYGSPRMFASSNGLLVGRTVSASGYMMGDPTVGGDRTIAMIAEAGKFMAEGTPVLHRTLNAKDCFAIVVPSTAEYGEIRSDARDNGLNVVTYDPSSPSEFEYAQQRAAESDGTSYFLPDDLTYEGFLEKYGKIRPGSNPRVERPVPRQTTRNNRVSQAFRTMMEAPVTTDETATDMRRWLVENGVGTYYPQSNARSIAKAQEKLRNYGSLKAAAAALHGDVASGTGRNTDLVALGELLFAQMQNDDTLTDAERAGIVADLQIVLTDSGRATQLGSVIKRMTPEGHIVYMEQVGKHMASKYEKRTKKPTVLTLTESELEGYRNGTPEEREKLDELVTKRWGEETSDLTWQEKMRNWRYFSMLANAKTHLRNITGNVLMMPTTRIKDSINALYQMADTKRSSANMPKLTQADRTTTGLPVRVDEQMKAYVAGRLEKALPIMQGVSSKYIESAHKAVKNGETEQSFWKRLSSPVNGAKLFNEKSRSNVLNKIAHGFNVASWANSNALEMEDALFLGNRFKSSMYQQIKAKGIDVNNITQAQENQIMNYAMEEALRATFRDASALADALRDFANSGAVQKALVEGLLPFKKTPINIAKRAIEYSPLGVVQGAYKMISNNANYKRQMAAIENLNTTEQDKQRRMSELKDSYIRERVASIDRLAAGTTGSILTALGGFAAMLGWISVKRDDDEAAAFENGLGKSNYSLNIGDTSIDLSAFSPAAVPFIIGATLYEMIADKRDTDGSPLISSVISSLCEAIDPISEMSVISSFADAMGFKSYGNESAEGTRKITQFFGSAASSLVGQFVPTVVGQIARSADPYARSYSAGDDYWASKLVGSDFGYFAKSLQNKVGLGWLSEPKVNVHGEEVTNFTNFGSWVWNALNQQILPATWKAVNKNDVDKELVRLYGTVDNTGMFPSKPSRTLGSYTDKTTGEPVNLKLTNDAEYMEYQKDYGQYVYEALNQLMSSSAYANMTDVEKASAIENAVDNAKKAVREVWKEKLAARTLK